MAAQSTVSSNLRRARAAQAGKPRSSKQKAASRHNLVHARAARSARKHGVGFTPSVSAKKPKAASLAVSGSLREPTPMLLPAGLPEAPDLHSLPVCAAVAVAASLRYQTGTEATAGQILALHRKSSGQLTLDSLLGLVAVEGFAGARLESFRPWDPDLLLDGLLYGIQLDIGYHAVLTVPGGMLSWDTVLPLQGEPEEAWLLEWEVPG